MAVVQVGDRIVVVDRKLFRDDNTRIFVGTVEAHDGGVIRARGFGFHVNPYEVTGTERHGTERVRLISVAGENVYLLGPDVDVGKLQLKRSPKALTLTDGEALSIDLTDFLLRA